MLYQRLNHFKHYYIDRVDPEGYFAKLAFRTALACIISILFFQLLGNNILSMWAGFATFCFVQNDIQEKFSKRLTFFIGLILVFTAFVFIGMLIGHIRIVYIIVAPCIIFLASYLACLGLNYFVACGWGLFLLILSGSNPSSMFETMQIVIAMLIAGVVSILICFVLFPLQPYQKIIRGFQRVLFKLIFLSHNYQQLNSVNLSKLTTQLDQILSLQEKNLSLYLEDSKLTLEQKTTCVAIAKALYQMSLMFKSALMLRQFLLNHETYKESKLDQCAIIVEQGLQSLLNQLRKKPALKLEVLEAELLSYRDILMQIRKKELMKPQAKMEDLLDYSNYFYHFIKIMDLMKLTSQKIFNLQTES